MCGNTRKLDADSRVPAAFVTEMRPLVASKGTVTFSDVAVTWVGVALAPLNLTFVVVSRLVPMIVTSVPTMALAGVKLVMTGNDAAAGWNARRYACTVPPVSPLSSHPTTGARPGGGVTASHALKPAEPGPAMPLSVAEPTPISTHAVPSNRATRIPVAVKPACDQATIGRPSAPISTPANAFARSPLRDSSENGAGASQVAPLKTLTRF